MRIRCLLAGTVALALIASTALSAQAHFVWVSLTQKPQPTASLYFGEGPEPSEAHLLDKVAQSQVFARSAEGKYLPLQLNKEEEGANGRWTTSQKDAQWLAIEAVCDYGVLEKGDAPFWLHYYAKSLDAKALKNEKLTSSEKLPLDVVVTPKEGSIQLEVRFQGKPVEGAEVVITDDVYNETTHETDAAGQVLLKDPKDILYSVRARWIEERSGEHNGKKYDSVRHYSTVALDLNENATTKTTAIQGTSATDLLAKSREARAVWDDFPGFTAKLTVTIEDKTQEGKLTVDEFGTVELEGFTFEKGKSPETTLRSLVGHRMPGDPSSTEADYVAEQGENGLGKLLKLKGDGMGSHYRVRNDVITEVNRQMERGKFSISVLSVHRNPEGKYLPEMFVVDSWNDKGDLTSSSATHHTWQRVGNFDLPQEMTVVRSGDNERSVMKLVFDDLKLMNQ